jgi:hypothetical protein
MVKVGGYILGEFGNLIAGDQRSAPSVQFQVTFRVSRGVKGSRIVGIMFAFSSLMGRVEEGGLSDWVIFNFFDSCKDWLTL